MGLRVKLCNEPAWETREFYALHREGVEFPRANNKPSCCIPRGSSYHSNLLGLAKSAATRENGKEWEACRKEERIGEKGFWKGIGAFGTLFKLRMGALV